MAIEINKIYYGWHDLEFSFVRDGQASEVFAEITALSFGHSTTVSNVYGTARNPQGQVLGQYVLEESSMTLYKEDWEILKAKLGDNGDGAGWMGSQFVVQVKYRKASGPIFETTIQGRLTGESEGLALGDDAVTVEVKFMPTSIKSNGQTPFRAGGT